MITNLTPPAESVRSIQDAIYNIRKDLSQGIIVPTDERLLPIIDRLGDVEEMVGQLGSQAINLWNGLGGGK